MKAPTAALLSTLTLLGGGVAAAQPVASRCADCHFANPQAAGRESKVAPASDFPSESRNLLTNVRDLRESLVQARKLVSRVADPVRRADLEEDLQAAEVPLQEAVRSAHMFVFAPMRERLRIARERTDFLLEDLANAPARPEARK